MLLSRRTSHTLLLSTALCSAVLLAPAAQAKTAVKAKPTKAKAAPKPKLIREVLGTQQLTGYEGALGQTFTVGTNSAINLTLKRAEYSTNRVNIGQDTYFTNSDQKLLILHFTVQNPLKRPLTFYSTYLNIKAVDASGVTRTAINALGREVTHESVNFALQPGQKIDVYSAIRVAAYGEVPKLIVQNGYDSAGPIVRYDLRGKVAKLKAPVVDPSDTKGATAQKLVPAKVGVFYPVAELFDVRIDGITHTTDPLQERGPGDDKQYCIATATVKNASPRAVRVGQYYFRADLKDADGEKVSYNTSMYKASRDEEANAELLPGEEARVRFYWVLPKNLQAKTVLLQYGYDRESRTYAVDVENAK